LVVNIKSGAVSGFVHFAMEKCLDLALRTEGAAGSVAPTQTPSGALKFYHYANN
jgi:hypothetical protein